jgi:hypothetical protein
LLADSAVDGNHGELDQVGGEVLDHGVDGGPNIFEIGVGGSVAIVTFRASRTRSPSSILATCNSRSFAEVTFRPKRPIARSSYLTYGCHSSYSLSRTGSKIFFAPARVRDGETALSMSGRIAWRGSVDFG